MSEQIQDGRDVQSSANTGDLRDKVAIVTGAASGIGLAIATGLAEAGAHVVLSDLRLDAAEEAASSLGAKGLSVEAVAADAGNEDDIKQLIETTVEQRQRIDIYVNNAGMQYVSSIEDFPIAKFQQIIQLMLVGPFISTKYVFPVMKRQKFGRIINIASINGLIGFAGKAAYNSAKHGVIGLTKVAALEGAVDGITVNALCPGYVDTPLVRNQLADLALNRGIPVEKVLEEVIYPLVPQRRLLDPKEVADYAVFLASEKGRSITGQAVVIDGGYVAQ
ncbi:3-hydroxybutyrate dehydrogenase [Alicyclobacillus mengziensis]|uniref:3-hydroxybutyrate dehydrogenase n=1 Tax=Alicyclobacillus mengziensis TaxID=2931921 RepID=A0A9X7W0E7_9BACL|nr:3-hydroxybutyrate dehydrogenase [Alicyclobacillus mengziensis]QSO47877.1 3-hydroxybutyrate dehydrogenase [Alicyclobacillus mengziensis]